MKNEIIIDGITYIKKEVVASKVTKKFKDVFDCKSIEDLFEFAGEDLNTFKDKFKSLTPKKLNLELIEKGIEIIRGDWKPTISNAWHYPYFERTPSGFSFSVVGCVCSDDVAFVPASLVLENNKQAELAGNILLPQYNIYMTP